MANFINKYINIEAYNADDGKQYPNVSYLIDQDIIKFEKNDPVHIVAVYNVTSTSEATKLLNKTTGITYQIIDDVRQDTVQTTYTFDTLGKHTVKYKLDGTNIDNSAFYDCTVLTSVTIPNSVTEIGRNSFYNCSALTSVTIHATTPPYLVSRDVFTNTNNCPIYVPAESLEAYVQDGYWGLLVDRLQPIPTE